MKKTYLITICALLLLGCQKELHQTPETGQASGKNYLTHIQQALKDSLSTADYAGRNFSKALISHDTATGKTYLRLGISGKKLAEDFMLLQTDSTGITIRGRFVHVDKQPVRPKQAQLFNGAFIISSLNRRITNKRQIVSGRFTTKADVSIMEEPAGTQDLAPVVVTTYTYNGDASMDWYLLSAFFDDGSGWMYGAASPEGSEGSGGGGAQPDQTIQVEAEPTNDPLAVVIQYLKCFGNLPAEGATYQISILSDIPVNGDPSVMFDWKTGSPGHSFIQLKETSGGTSIQQNLGFYPTTGWKTPAGPTTSKMLDNAGHEFNAELTITVSAEQFQNALTKMQEFGIRQYDLATFNCTDFALAVFNAANPEQLSVPQYTIPGNSQSSNTPQGLYNEILLVQQTGNQAFGNPTIPGVAGFVGASHGPCN